MKVRDLMTTDVVTCDLDASVRDAVGLMLDERVGCVVVTREGDPAGLLTETDALYAGYVTGSPFDEIPLRKAASDDIVTVAPDATVRKAATRMRQQSVKKLLAVEDIDVVGVLTMTDIVHHHQDFIDEARSFEGPRDRWESEEWADEE